MSLCFSSVLYYWSLLFPTLCGTAILLIAAMLGGYGGLICGFLFPWLARSIFTQYHRMVTYQRFDRTNVFQYPPDFTVCDGSLFRSNFSSFQVTQSNLLGNPHGWHAPFLVVLLWKDNAYYPLQKHSIVIALLLDEAP